MAGFSNFDISQDTIFVTGLPEDTTEEQISEYFGQIGVIKFDKKNNCPKIWIYKDKATGKGKGEATITYDDPPTATSAISWFNGKEFRGALLSIELAQRKSAPQFSRGGGIGGGGGGGGGGGRGRGGASRGDVRPGGYDNRGDRGPRDDRGRQSAGPGRPGDWVCPSCSNNNFAYRQECNRCRTQKPAGAGNESSTGNTGSSYNNGGSTRYRDDSSRGSNFGSRGSANFRDNDMRSRERNSDRDRYGGGERDRERYGNDRERNRGGYASGGHGGGPSRNHRGKDDRRSRPY